MNTIIFPNDTSDVSKRAEAASYLRLPRILLVLGIIITPIGVSVAYLAGIAAKTFVAFWWNAALWAGPAFILAWMVVYFQRVDAINEHPRKQFATRFEARLTTVILMFGISVILLLLAYGLRLFVIDFSSSSGGLAL